jgi:hypothetical protein
MTTVDVGVRILQEELRGHGFELVQRQKLFDRRASYLVIQHSDSKQQIDFVLTDEYLSDLEKTPGYLPSLKSHLAAFTFRIQNISWNSFYCISGPALNIEIQWPSEVMPQRAASVMWVNVRDLAQPSLVALCSAVMTHSLYQFVLKPDPLAVFHIIVNSVREAVDRNELKFYKRDEHPQELQIVDARAERRSSPANAQEIETFVCGKIYWLRETTSTNCGEITPESLWA